MVHVVAMSPSPGSGRVRVSCRGAAGWPCRNRPAMDRSRALTSTGALAWRCTRTVQWASTRGGGSARARWAVDGIGSHRGATGATSLEQPPGVATFRPSTRVDGGLHGVELSYSLGPTGRRTATAERASRLWRSRGGGIRSATFGLGVRRSGGSSTSSAGSTTCRRCSAAATSCWSANCRRARGAHWLVIYRRPSWDALCCTLRCYFDLPVP